MNLNEMNYVKNIFLLHIILNLAIELKCSNVNFEKKNYKTKLI